jgi:hypothetical protein
MWLASTIWVVVFLFVGLAAIVLICLAASTHVSILASAFLFAIASLAAGVFVGFLFGVPRTLSSGREVEHPAVSGSRSSIRANTNLEQVSDWLTKILIGATLVQLGNVPSAGARG